MCSRYDILCISINVLIGRRDGRLKIRASFTIALIVFPVHKLVIIHCKTIFIFIASLFFLYNKMQTIVWFFTIVKWKKKKN